MKILEVIEPAGTEYRLVRVVPSINNLVLEPNGTISIRQQEGSSRNSIHWTMNSTVGSHTLGNWDKAGIVIIADPKEIRAPLLGARPDDTWYALDKNNKLNIGHAKILVPAGTEVPKGIPVEQYTGDRNQAVKQALNKQGVKFLGTTGASGVGNLSINQFGDMGKDFAKKHGTPGSPATLDSHMNTLHSRAEGKLSGINYAIDKMQSGQERIQLGNRSEMPYTTHTQEEIARFKQEIAQYQKQHPQAAQYEAAYWKRINTELDQASRQVDALDAKFQADRQARIAARKQAQADANKPPPPPNKPLSMADLKGKGKTGGGSNNDISSPDYSMGLDPSYGLQQMKRDQMDRVLKKGF